MKKLLSFIVIFTFTLIGHAKAGEFSLSAALVGMSMDYREYGVTDSNGYGIYDSPRSMDHILNSEKSNYNEILGGDFTLSYKNTFESDNYMKLTANMIILAGTTEYVGSYIGSTDGYGSAVESTTNNIFDTSVNYSYTQVFDTKIALSYGLGVGYHFWRRELSPSQVEVYSWYSLRPNLALEYFIDQVSFGVSLEYQYGVLPRMMLLKNTQHGDTEVKLGAANILQFSIPVQYQLSKYFDLFVEYTYENQIIDKSNQVALNNSEFWEPRSEANNQYLKFGATFKF